MNNALIRQLPLHVLQRICCNSKTETGSIFAGDLHFDGDDLSGLAGQYAKFDGIFGAFFDGYWKHHTGIEDLVLSFDLTGRVEISIERIASSSGQPNQILHTVVESAGERVTLPVPMTGGEDTRLVLTTRLISDSKLGTLAWATFTPPVRTVGLTAVICTFNRERDVAATLDELLANSTGLRRILVVNQGEPGIASRLPQHRVAQETGILTVLDQRNLGGAGGFGRGMLESLSDDGCSHLLLMDDDIDLDASSIGRLITVLSYLTSDHAIGGAMLDQDSRTRLFSVGDVLDRRKPEIRNLVDPGANDITLEATSRYLALQHRPDFNGWWFFAFSKEQIRRIGLPLPLFIRGDDVEYGFRLTVSGTSTLSWPGLAVWHEPFHTKRHPWHYFYDRRNSLFLCEAHGRLGRIRLLEPLLTGFLNHLLRFDYDRASCITLGLRAFNEGSVHLKSWNGSDHARLVKAFGSRERPATNGDEPRCMARSPIPTLLLFAARLTKDLLRRTSAEGTPILVLASHWRPVVQHRPTPVIIHYEDSRTTAEFHHDRERTRACSRAFAREIIRFLIRPWHPMSLKALSNLDFWSSYTS